MATGPRDVDSVDAVQLLRVALWFGPACFIMLSGLWFFAFTKGWISIGVLIFLVILNVPLSAAGVFGIYRTVGQIAVLFAKTVLAGGDIAPPPTYPRQDVLIVRGKYEDAADCFRDHLQIEPQDHEARLRLAQLLETHLKRHDEAERLYLEIRRAKPPADAQQQMRAANGLIDLYRKLGKLDRLKVELARFVDRYRGTRFAEGAARELQELKAAEL